MPRNDEMVVIVQIASLAIATLIDYLRNTPRTSAEADDLDRAALELIAQTSNMADAVRARLGAPDVTPYPPLPECPPENLPPLPECPQKDLPPR